MSDEDVGREVLARARMKAWPGYRPGGTWESIGQKQRDYWLGKVARIDALAVGEAIREAEARTRVQVKAECAAVARAAENYDDTLQRLACERAASAILAFREAPSAMKGGDASAQEPDDRDPLYPIYRPKRDAAPAEKCEPGGGVPRSVKLPSAPVQRSAVVFTEAMAEHTGRPTTEAAAATRECMDNLGLTPRRIDAAAAGETKPVVAPYEPSPAEVEAADNAACRAIGERMRAALIAAAEVRAKEGRS